MWEAIVDNPWLSVFGGIGILFVALAVQDIFQTKHTIRHNYPLLGRLRYLLELIGPELRQYWVAADTEEQPFNRNERSWIYASAKGTNKNQGFGTAELVYGIGYPIIKNSAFPFPDGQATWPGDDSTAIPCTKVLGERRGRRRPYRPSSIVNISAMSFGALGNRAQSALNKGALVANCYHNTGEGGISPYHGEGADLMWQIGTGYFGARDDSGRFSLDRVAQQVEQYPQVRAIEIKLSQGAKPGKGGILPGAKVTRQIAEIRGVPVGEDCISPNAHAEFKDVDGLIDFVEQIAQRTGIPVGIKSAVGKLDFWQHLAERMKARDEGPDFITIDGGEGGTGAAPITFADHVSLPFKIAFQRVYQTFQNEGIASDVVWIGSAKLGFPDRTVVALAMGCDLVHIAREAMIAIGCIQAQKCHTGECPTGIATQSRWLQAGVNVEEKAKRFATYVRSFRSELLQLARASGYEHPSQYSGDDIEFSTGPNKFSTLNEVLGYRRDEVGFTSCKELTPLP